MKRGKNPWKIYNEVVFRCVWKRESETRLALASAIFTNQRHCSLCTQPAGRERVSAGRFIYLDTRISGYLYTAHTHKRKRGEKSLSAKEMLSPASIFSFVSFDLSPFGFGKLLSRLAREKQKICARKYEKKVKLG